MFEPADHEDHVPMQQLKVIYIQRRIAFSINIAYCITTTL
jgi:hypothetical protein